MTNTEGVNWKDLTYEQYCTRDGYLQQTADLINSVGINASDENGILGQKLVLRGAESIDAIENVARSGTATSPAASSGYILCAITEIGGLLYVLLCVTVALILLAFLPCFNFLVEFFYDVVYYSGAAASSRSRRRRGTPRPAPSAAPSLPPPLPQAPAGPSSLPSRPPPQPDPGPFPTFGGAKETLIAATAASRKRRGGRINDAAFSVADGIRNAVTGGRAVLSGRVNPFRIQRRASSAPYSRVASRIEAGVRSSDSE